MDIEEKVKRKKKAFKSSKGGTPTLVIPGATHADITCYGCGEQGHRRGDPVCPAGPDAIWSGAPTKWKQYQTKIKARGGASNGKDLCRDFQRGYCRYGDKCKFAHGTKPGGKQKRGPGSKRSAQGGDGRGTSFSKSQKKTVENIVAVTLKSALKEAVGDKGTKRKREMEEDSLSTLITNVISANMCLTHTVPREPVFQKSPVPILSMELHLIEHTVGIDTDAAFSCSTRRVDFICLNTPPGAISAIPPPTGVGGAQTVGGIGACIKKECCFCAIIR